MKVAEQFLVKALLSLIFVLICTRNHFFPMQTLQTKSADLVKVPPQTQAQKIFSPEEKVAQAKEALGLLSGQIQPKLNIGQPNDPYEQEADRIAEQVVSTPVQRKCATCQAEEESTLRRKSIASQITPLSSSFPQRKCTACEAEEQLQGKFLQRQGEASSQVESQINRSKGGGSPMDQNIQSEMSQKFGTDFSGVRIHTGSPSVQMNQELGAKAFTVGNDIHFNQGEYSPGSTEGKRLLAHELTHTVQQSLVRGNASIAPLSIQRQLTPPGNCEQYEHDQIQKLVKQWCDHSSGRACNEGDSCNRLRQKIKRNQQCAKFRKKINDLCYEGGDEGHRTAEREARNAQRTCMAFYVKKCQEKEKKPEINWQNVLNVVLAIGLSVLLVPLILAALLDPEPATKLALAGLSAVAIVYILEAFGLKDERQA